MEEAVRKCGYESWYDLNKSMQPSIYSIAGPEMAIKNHMEISSCDTTKARQLLPCELDVECGPGERQKLDFYYPQAIPKDKRDRDSVKTVFVYIHGGCWQALSKENGGAAALPLARAADVVTVAVGYDLGPQVTVTEIVEQCIQAVLFVARKFPHAMLVGGGHSCGAHLMASVLHEEWSQHGLERCPLKGAFLLDGIFDLAPYQLCEDNKATNVTDHEVSSLSPCLWEVVSKDISCLIVTAQHATPEYIRQSRQYHKVLMDAGAVSHFLQMANEDHFTLADSLGDEKHFLTQVLISFIKTLSSAHHEQKSKE